MENFLQFCQLLQLLFLSLYLVTSLWAFFSGRNLYKHSYNLKYLRHLNWLIRTQSFSLLMIAALPPFTFMNWILFVIWLFLLQSRRRARWNLFFLRLELRAYEKDLVAREGLGRLIEEFEMAVKEISKIIDNSSPGTFRYNLAVSFYINAKRRLDKMKTGQNYGHFPLPKF